MRIIGVLRGMQLRRCIDRRDHRLVAPSWHWDWTPSTRAVVAATLARGSQASDQRATGELRVELVAARRRAARPLAMGADAGGLVGSAVAAGLGGPSETVDAGRVMATTQAG